MARARKKASRSRSRGRSRRRRGGVLGFFRLEGLFRRALLGGLALGVLTVGVLGFVPTWIPLKLPSLDEPTVIYARPHRISVGQGLRASGLVDRLKRLGYRQSSGRELAPGEFKVGDRSLDLHRRAFETRVAKGDSLRVRLALSSGGRIQSIVGASGGKSVPSLLLEPDVVGELHTDLREYRESVPLDKIPEALVDAVLAIEDRKFYEHAGIDLRRIGGAFIANLTSDGGLQGGSTITQQLVKNVYLDARRTIERKLLEVWYARRVEAGNDKDAILETYLNTIYLGQRGSVSIRGVEGAARHYFGKHVTDLGLGECALLAGMIRGPGLYSPYTNPEAGLVRRDRVLRILRDLGKITTGEYEREVARPLDVLPEPPEPVAAPYFVQRIKAILQEELPDRDIGREGLSVLTGIDASYQMAAEKAVAKGLAAIERDDPALRAEGEPLQAAMVVLDPQTGDVLGLVGGRDFRRNQFDRATQALRQTGSAFKPVVALSALSRGDSGKPHATLASRYEDAPLRVETKTGVWEPENYDGEYRGVVSLREAVERSLNIPVARLGLEVGPERIIETARKLGIESRLDPVPSIALGAFEATPIEIARAYAVFASGGIRTNPRFFSEVRDAEGALLASRDVVRDTVFDGAEVALVTSALQGVVNRGTARGIRAAGYMGPLAGKTGTSNDFRDAWFVAYTPELVVAVWVGFDDGRTMKIGGSQAAVPIALEFLKIALGAGGYRDFTDPDGLEVVQVNAESGLRAGFGCDGAPEVFLRGTAPVERCSTRIARRPEDTRANERRERARRETARRERRPSGLGGLVRDIFDILGGR